MQFTEQQIEEFRTLYFKRFRREISKADALEQATKLITLIRLIFRPMKAEEWDAIQKSRLESLPEILKRFSED